MHSKFSTPRILCNAYDDMSNFSARSKHQRCYKGPQEMFDRLMTMVVKSRGYGCDELDDHKVVKIMLEAYSPRNETLVTLIRDKKKLNTSHQMMYLGGS